MYANILRGELIKPLMRRNSVSFSPSLSIAVGCGHKSARFESLQVGDGSYLFTIRSGWKPIEFDKGKSAIVVLSHDKLPAIIDTLIAAVRNGELDGHLAQGSKVGMVKKRKAA
jgi:hypothetical protein